MDANQFTERVSVTVLCFEDQIRLVNFGDHAAGPYRLCLSSLYVRKSPQFYSEFKKMDFLLQIVKFDGEVLDNLLTSK